MSENHPPAPQSFFRRIFISPGEPRLRAGWRLLLQTLLMIIITIPVSLLASLVRIDRSGGVLFSQIIELVIFVSSIYIARRFLDKRSFVSLGLQVSKQTLTDILAGIGITFVMMGLIYAAEVAAGWLTFENFAWQTESITNVVFQTVLFFVIFIFVGWNEELLSRGYHLQTIASGTNIFWGMVISSSVFGLAHLGNPNATWVSAAGIFFAGIFLGYAYLRTGQLWLSIGLHIGWNFFEGVIFGFPVSGLDIYHLTHNQIQGPEIWTGGAFGPEAGLIVLPALVIGSALIWFYTRDRIASQENH
jgi:membrane protease YdiL (CAAX protease family)